MIWKYILISTSIKASFASAKNRLNFSDFLYIYSHKILTLSLNLTFSNKALVGLLIRHYQASIYMKSIFDDAQTEIKRSKLTVYTQTCTYLWKLTVFIYSNFLVRELFVNERQISKETTWSVAKAWHDYLFNHDGVGDF